MGVPDHLERKLTLISEPDLKIQSSLSMQIRGSNFQKVPATIFIDSNKGHWLWKYQSIPSLAQEYLISFLASQLDLSIPRSIIAKKNHTLGLIQEWILNGKELHSYSDSQVRCKNRNKILDLLIFEAWIGALDRHGGNYLINEGEVWAIDFEDSFEFKTNGSELCLYFPWIRETQEELDDTIKAFKTKISKKRLLEKETLLKQCSILLKTLKDSRAKNALLYQLKKIHDLLQENYFHLETLVYNHLKQNNDTFDLTVS